MREFHVGSVLAGPRTVPRLDQGVQLGEELSERYYKWNYGGYYAYSAGDGVWAVGERAAGRWDLYGVFSGVDLLLFRDFEARFDR